MSRIATVELTEAELDLIVELVGVEVAKLRAFPPEVSASEALPEAPLTGAWVRLRNLMLLRSLASAAKDRLTTS